MVQAVQFPERPQSLGEEIANSVSHGIGFLAAAAAAPVLVLAAVQRGGAAGILSAAVFAAAAVLLYLASTLSHALPKSRARHLFEDLDLDSIDAVDLVVKLQDLTGRKFKPEEFKSVRTVGDILDRVQALLLAA